jgi:hypothetical protein
MEERQFREQEAQIAHYHFLSREVTDPLAVCLHRVIVEDAKGTRLYDLTPRSLLIPSTHRFERQLVAELKILRSATNPSDLQASVSKTSLRSPTAACFSFGLDLFAET